MTQADQPQSDLKSTQKWLWTPFSRHFLNHAKVREPHLSPQVRVNFLAHAFVLKGKATKVHANREVQMRFANFRVNKPCFRLDCRERYWDTTVVCKRAPIATRATRGNDLETTPFQPYFVFFILERSWSSPPSPAKRLPKSFGKLLSGKCPGALTRKSRKSPENNSTGIYFRKSPFPARAPFSGERRRRSYQTPKFISVTAPGALTGFFGKSPENISNIFFMPVSILKRGYRCSQNDYRINSFWARNL